MPTMTIEKEKADLTAERLLRIVRFTKGVTI